MSKAIEPSRDDILEAVAKGNPGALEFLRVFARRAHAVDDLADLDVPMAVDVSNRVQHLAYIETEWLLLLSSNTFFLAHRAQLVPAMILALNAWVDSERFDGDVRDVVKGQWHEVVWLVAFLVGGTNHLRAMTWRFRAYDLEQSAEDLKRKVVNGLPG